MHDRLTLLLRDMIIEGRLAPGARLIEVELCRRLGVSRTPLRESLKVLAGEGLIDLQPNRGATVTVPTAAETRELFTVIAELEALAAALCCVHLRKEHLDHLARLHERMILYRKKDDLRGYFKLNDEIHNTVVALSGNQILVATHQRLMARARRTRYQALLVHGRWDTSIAEHEALMAALRARNGKRAAGIWRAHVTATGDYAVARWSESEFPRQIGAGKRQP